MSSETLADSKYIVLHKLRRELRKAGLDLKSMLMTALNFLHRELEVEYASVFLAGDDSHVIREYLRLEKTGEVLAGEHEQPVWKGSEMHALLTGAKNVYAIPYEDQSSHVTIFIRLGVDSGAAGSASTRGILETRISSQANLDLLLAWCEEVGEWLELSFLDERLKNQSKQIESFGELSWLFVTSLRLEDRLKLLLEGIQKIFHFDRIRLYLVDPGNKELKGELETDFRGEVRSLAHESYILPAPETSSLVEVLAARFRQDPWSRVLEQTLTKHDKVLYIPLKIQRKEIGVVVVDNLLSQEPISADVRHLLDSFAGQIAMAVDNARLFGEVEKLSLYDAMTRMPNRRFFEMKFQEELYRAGRTKEPFALCLLDLDFFKEINDTYGHQMGDRAIISTGQAINTVVRQSDFAARWGGDEIAILLSATAPQEIPVVVERILNAIREITLVYPATPPKEIKITASMGVAIWPQDGTTLEELLAKADQALYQVKFQGRNNFILASQIKSG